MKNYSFEKLEPRGVLTWFKKICAIPHGSFNEAALADMLKHELNKAGCNIKQFSSGAIYARKAATKGYEKRPMVALQAHMDMVLVKNPNLNINLEKEAIKPFYDTTDDCLKCDGTTLGADNGIGVAAIMEIMTSNKYQHGPLEALLTVCEEKNIQYCMESIPDKYLKAKHLINLDNDIPDKMYVGSNGTMKVCCQKKLHLEPTKSKTKTYIITVEHFDGGHSALMIHNPNTNAVAWLSEALYSFTQEHSKIRLIEMNGGQAMNAIPTFCKMKIQLDPKDFAELKKHLSHALATAKQLAQGLDVNARVSVVPSKTPAKKASSYEETEKILFFLSYVPHSVCKMDITMKHIFSASNIGVVRTEDDIIHFTLLPRSFSYGDLDRHFNTIRYFGALAGLTNYERGFYSRPWLTEHPEKSPTVQAWINCYHKVTGKYSFPVKDPGGIEPSELVVKNPQLKDHSISVGPRIREEHSIRERVEVATIRDFWKSLLLLLKEIK